MSARTLTKWLATHDGFTAIGALRALTAPHGNASLWLVAGTYAGCLTAFVADLLSANTLAFGVFYMPLVATAVFHRDRRAVWVLTAVALFMVAIGSFFPRLPHNLWELVENRTLSVCAILVTAAFVWRARTIQDQLAQQTAQAEASERIRAEVLTNLSDEIRAPLHGMIGVLELVAASGDPSQRMALNMVRVSGRRLVTMVDNLVDLTQLDDMVLPAEPVDLALLTRQMVESKRREAAERQIDLSIDIFPAAISNAVSAPAPLAFANAWAVRRILENKVGDAVAYTAPGGQIKVSVASSLEEVSVVITTSSGSWPNKAAGDPMITPLAPSAMGLALSQRLTSAIGGQLSFTAGSDQSATLRLTLPAVRDAGPAAARQD